MSPCLSPIACIKQQVSKYLEKYLATYGSPQAKFTDFDRSWSNVIVIPAYQEEASEIIQNLALIACREKFLVIVVANSYEADDKQTRAMANDLAKGVPKTPISDETYLLTYEKYDILIVDCFSESRLLKEKEGVGAARKIGCDIALRLIASKKIKSQWIYSSDADAALPENYFQSKVEQDNVATIFSFSHTYASEISKAMLLYEVKLLYYTAGLVSANSPYAYLPLGSCLCFSAEAYAKTRGFRKINAGEDFYLLNKLRKIGKVLSDKEIKISLRGRLSERTPIGTGQGTRKILNDLMKGEVVLFENPECFHQLKLVIDMIEQLALDQRKELIFPNEKIQTYLQGIQFSEHYHAKREQNPSYLVMKKHLHDWFDALKTRQFIKHLQDTHYYGIPVERLGDAFFLRCENESKAIIKECSKQIFGS